MKILECCEHCMVSLSSKQVTQELSWRRDEQLRAVSQPTVVESKGLWAGSPRGTSHDWHPRSCEASFKRQRERMAGVWECNTSLYLLGRRTLTVFHYYFQKRTSGKLVESAAFRVHNEPEFRGQNDNADGKVRGLTLLSQHKFCKLFQIFMFSLIAMQIVWDNNAKV